MSAAVQSAIRALRVARRATVALTLLLAGLLILRVVFPRAGFARRDRIIARWSRLLLGACGVSGVERVARGGTALSELSGGVLLLLNHISWLDIFVVLAHRPAHFVAKIEIAGWPLIGRLVIGAGTLFIERGRRHAVHQLNERIESMLKAGRPVAVFPEGTTSDGRRLLQFHGNLIEPARRAGVSVVPVGLRYLTPSGHATDAVDFTGDTTLVQSLLRVLGAPGLVAVLHPLPAVEGVTRQRIAQRARQAISDELALPMDDQESDTLARARAPGRPGPG